MERLCDEIIQLIFFELHDPSHFVLISKRFYQFSQDPYVRAHYFLNRYGRIQAMYWALGRGKVINERVLDILLTSGAHLSRYLVQVAIHHYFRTSTHFVKSNWVRSMPFPVFTYFLKMAADMYGEIPCGKGEDDGSMFSNFLKESRFPTGLKSIAWEEIRDILELYHFIPFCNRDPIMAQFPLALAIEPRLLPLATANGFHMDSKYRDFVFRKMFERPALAHEARSEEIVHNVRELCRLDATMFLSRTVAAEVCMEAKVNEPAYGALKELDKSGDLLFELPALVEDLIKLFIKTRSVTSVYTIQVLRQLFTDFPSSDPTVRLVMLLTVFLSDNCLANNTPTALRNKLEPLGLTPLTRKDIFNILINPFVEKYVPILEFAKVEVGLSNEETCELVEEVAVKVLEIGCKGRMLRKLLEGFPSLQDTIASVVSQQYRLSLDDLPLRENEKACTSYEAKLCRDYISHKFVCVPTCENEGEDAAKSDDRQDDLGNHGSDETEARAEVPPQLGRIGQDTLTTMIRQDEMAPSRSRRRNFYPYTVYTDIAGKLHYPNDSVQVGRWVKSQFGVRSPVTAVFMTHAVINNNSGVIQQYLGYTESLHNGTTVHVPITLNHFKMLARLGRAPNWCLYHDIESGAEFYFSEDDYISQVDSDSFRSADRKVKVKVEATQDTLSAAMARTLSLLKPEGSRSKKRPRRMAAVTVRSYAVPDSDDEAIADEYDFGLLSGHARKKKVESNLQRWIKHLSILLKDEQKKYKEKKKRLERSEDPDSKTRILKGEFLKSLSSNLRSLRKVDLEKRLLLYGPEVADDYFTDEGDDEYLHKPTRGKRRKTFRCL